MTSPFSWHGQPSESGQKLGRIDATRAASTKSVEKALKAGVNRSTIYGLSKKQQILQVRPHGGAYSKATQGDSK